MFIVVSDCMRKPRWPIKDLQGFHKQPTKICYCSSKETDM